MSEFSVSPRKTGAGGGVGVNWLEPGNSKIFAMEPGVILF